MITFNVVHGLKNISLICVGTAIAMLFASCAFPTRTGYDRSIGGYKSAASAGSENVAGSNSTAGTNVAGNTSGRQTSAGAQKSAAAQKMAATNAPAQSSATSLEAMAKTWIGTPYVYGGSSRSGTDCSGYVLNIYKDLYGITLPRTAADMYKDGRGSSVSRGSLKEGDLVFFGSFWKIDHVGIYLSGDRFTHASSSQGVTITPMSNSYWSPKYQGARRFR